MKFKYLTVIVLTANYFSAQNGKVVVATSTPTENFDVNGTIRLRNLPNNGATNAIYTTGANSNSGSTPTQTFNGLYPVLADSNGVLGKSTTSELIPNNNTTGFSTTNTSAAAFVIKRFVLEDNTGGTTGTYNNSNGFNTGMNINDWQAIMSNILVTITSNASGSCNTPFVNGGVYNYRLKAGPGGTWRIIGDIRCLRESAVIDVLFIKSKFVAAESRTN